MRCPHCGQEMPSRTCPECGGETPSEGRFCMACGLPLSESRSGLHEESQEGPDLDDRVLCPDGTCTGIIVDGRCSECGKTLDAHET